MHDISNENLSVFSIHTNRLCHDCRYLFKNWVEKGTSDSRVSKVFNIQESCDEDDMSVLEPYFVPESNEHFWTQHLWQLLILCSNVMEQSWNSVLCAISGFFWCVIYLFIFKFFSDFWVFSQHFAELFSFPCQCFRVIFCSDLVKIIWNRWPSVFRLVEQRDVYNQLVLEQAKLKLNLRYPESSCQKFENLELCSLGASYKLIPKTSGLFLHPRSVRKAFAKLQMHFCHFVGFIEPQGLHDPLSNTEERTVAGVCKAVKMQWFPNLRSSKHRFHGIANYLFYLLMKTFGS